MQIIKSIQNRIYTIRGERVMLDFDLAALYEVETRVLNQAVKRNLKRFPDDFMFRLSAGEWQNMQSQIVTASPMSSQFVMTEMDNNPTSQSVMLTLPKNRTGKYLPYAFTEQGVAMLSGILNSDKAINTNIAIMRAFIEVRKVLLKQTDIREQLREIKERMGEHDTQLNQIYDAMENLLDEKAAQRKWDDRQRIGFKQ